jgi:hypothetical protein
MQPYIPVDDCCALRMLKKLKSLFSGSHPAALAIVPHIPEGERVYAVGDIHGRLDLFEQLIARIEADDLARGPARTCVVLLGDLIDRGEQRGRDRAGPELGPATPLAHSGGQSRGDVPRFLRQRRGAAPFSAAWRARDAAQLWS